MNKLDLIVDALEQSTPKVNWDRHHKALAAARELRALKPVAWIHVYESGTGYQPTSLSLSDKSKIPTIHKPISLYALGESNE